MEYIIEGSIFDYEPSRNDFLPGSPLARFAEHVTRPDDNIDLIEAAMLIATAEYPGLNIGYYLQRLEIMGNDVRLLLADETDPHQIVETLNSYLFKTLGYKGNQNDYNDPRNSFLNDVLERRMGIPITLSLLYIEIGRQAGLPLEGVGLPGHFIVRFRKHAQQTFGRWENPNGPRPEESEEDILLDPFNEGAILTVEDCARMVQELYGRPMPMLQSFLRPVNNRAFLMRMLTNLKSNYLTDRDFERALRVEQFLLALNPNDWEEIRDRGVLSYQSGQRLRAMIDMQNYLRHRPEATDAEFIRTQISNIQREVAKNN